jgi:hypothetical protein
MAEQNQSSQDNRQGATEGATDQTTQNTQTNVDGQQGQQQTQQQADTTGTITGQGGEGQQKPAPQTWPDDWRDRLSKGDERRANMLGRYTSPEALADALIAAQDKIRSGQLKSALPENATEEQVKAWRAENGIPEKPEGYLENLPRGVVVSDEDRELALDFAKALHAKNASPQMIHEALKWHTDFAERREAALVEADKANWAETEDALRQEWGPEYTPNKNAVVGLLDMLPGGQETRDLILTARGADGRKLGGNPEILRGLAQIARMVNPAGTVVPGAPSNAGQTIKDELARIAEVRRTNPNKYYGDQKMIDREVELTAAQERLGQKAA